MTSPEFIEHDALGEELLVGVSCITTDVFLRSGLAVDTNYSLVEVTTMRTPDEEVTLTISSGDNNACILIFGENHRVESDSGEECFSMGLTIGLQVEGDGSGLQFRYGGHGSMSLKDATEYLMNRLPDFDGAEASIEVSVPKAE